MRFLPNPSGIRPCVTKTGKQASG
ncbi:MAG: hypothetical protein U0R21_08430 [Nocardioidaceae bacterium]